MNYTLITIFGAVISCVFAAAVMADLTEYRISERKAHIAVAIFTALYFALVLLLYITSGSTRGGQLYMFYGTIPFIIFFMAVSLYRDGRLFFSLFASHILLISVICATNLVDSLFPTKGQLVFSIARIIIFPALFFLIHRYLAAPYKKVQSQITVS